MPDAPAKSKAVKLKMNCGLAGNYFNYAPADIVDFSSDPDGAERLVVSGQAEYAEEAEKAKHTHYPAGTHPREIAAEKQKALNRAAELKAKRLAARKGDAEDDGTK